MLVFAVLEACFFASNTSKLLHGGWFPLVLATMMFTVLTTWRTGIEVLRAKKEVSKHDVQDGLTMNLEGIPRVPGVTIMAVHDGPSFAARWTSGARS